MLSFQLSNAQNFKKTRSSSLGYSVNEIQILKRPQFDQKKRIAPFSNNVLKKSCVKQKICDQVIQIKLHKDYSPRKQTKLFNSPLKNSSRDNPYSSIIEEHKKLQLVMLNSFRKSFNIEKKPILQLRPLSPQKSRNMKLARSKTSFQLGHQRNKSQQQQNEQKEALPQKQQIKNRRRLVHSAIGNRSATKILKNSIVKNDFFKTNLPSKSILFS